MLIDPVKVKDILVVRNDRFGEFLLNIPAIRALKETFPYARIVALVSPSVKELAACINYIDEVIDWGMGKPSFFVKLRMLKTWKPDIAVIMNPSKELNILTYLAAVPIRVGYDRKWGFLLTHKIKDTKYLGQKHEVEYNLELVEAIGAKTADTAISLSGLLLSVNPEYVGAIAIHPFTSDPVKQWPIERFRELAEKIIKELKLKVIFVGRTNQGQSSRHALIEQTAGIAASEFINLINKTSLIDLAQVLKQCKLLISGDSGPMHLAAAVGTPVVTLFRNDLPGKTARRWGPWGKSHTVIENSSLLNITVDEVFSKLKGI